MSKTPQNLNPPSKAAEAAVKWLAAGRQFYDHADFLANLKKVAEFRKVAEFDDTIKFKERHFRRGDIIVDMWGRAGIVIEAFDCPENPPSSNCGYCDINCIVRMKEQPTLKEKKYWKHMVRELWRVAA